MIDWFKSAELNNTTIEHLKLWFDEHPNSCKRIINVCGNCGHERNVKFQGHHDLCRSCSKSGKNHPLWGTINTEETKRKRKDNMPDLSGENHSMYGKHHTEETKKKISEGQKGEKHHNWKGGISNGKYCSLFNNKFKEIVRNSYNRRCFLCGKPESENGDRKHDVHHVNYDKDCLCGYPCEFVPLCRSCHSKTNSNRKYWEDLIIHYLHPRRYFMIDL